jgi:hypothetical protein
MRTTPSHPVGRLVAMLGAILLVAACTEPGGDNVRSPAPTGSLTPASSAEASASPSSGGDLRGAGGNDSGAGISLLDRAP